MHGPPFQRPFTTVSGADSGLQDVARTSISEAFNNAKVYDKDLELVARTSISEAFPNCHPHVDVHPLRCTDLHFRGLSQQEPQAAIYCCVLHGPPFQRPFTTLTLTSLTNFCCTDLHFRGLSQRRASAPASLACCTDLHFRGLSQL